DALGVVVTDQAVDTTPAARLLFHVFGAVAEFERSLIRDRVAAGLRRAQERGMRSGRPIGRPGRGPRRRPEPTATCCWGALVQNRQGSQGPIRKLGRKLEGREPLTQTLSGGRSRFSEAVCRAGSTKASVRRFEVARVAVRLA